MQSLYVLFRTKGQQNVDPFEYLNQYYKVKMALIESIYISKTVVSLQIKSTRGLC